MATASAPRLSAIDLNLLVALDALLRERNVTAAGRRIGLSQSATSHALARLRELFDDPLLVRDGRALRRTALAERLAPRIERLLAEVELAVLGHRAFEPARAARVFRVSTNDYCGAVLLPELVARVRRAAPRVELEVHAHRGRAPLDELARGELDVALGAFLRPGAGLQHRALFDDRFVCLVREGHPRVGARLTLARYVELDHVLVSAPDYGPGVVDITLEARALRRRVAVRVPHFLVAPALVARSDLVLTLPERLARLAASAHRLRVLAPPIEVPPTSVDLVWHERAAADPAVAWLREQLVAAAGAL